MLSDTKSISSYFHRSTHVCLELVVLVCWASELLSGQQHRWFHLLTSSTCWTCPSPWRQRPCGLPPWCQGGSPSSAESSVPSCCRTMPGVPSLRRAPAWPERTRASCGPTGTAACAGWRWCRSRGPSPTAAAGSAPCSWPGWCCWSRGRHGCTFPGGCSLWGSLVPLLLRYNQSTV